jgi:tRNA(Arg) A34 adenosine deaminase TadA
MADADFLGLAIALSREALADDVGGPFGAVVVRKGVVVGRGRNRVLADRDPTAHAEVVALREAARALGTHDLRGCEVFASCEPCPMCYGALHWARVDRVTYANAREDAAAIGFDDARLHDELARPTAARSLPMTRVARPEALAVLRSWASKPGRRLY